MKFDASTPRREVTIANHTFTVPAPYADGHVLSANEAAALNQLLGENIRNNMASAVKLALDGAPAVEGKDGKPGKDAVPPTHDSAAAFQPEIDKYVAGYEFGVGSVRVTDPVEKETIALATQIVKDALAKKGLKQDKESVDRYVQQILGDDAKSGPIRAQARKIVDQRKKVGGIELGDMFN
jgi:hypothetical protein